MGRWLGLFTSRLALTVIGVIGVAALWAPFILALVTENFLWLVLYVPAVAAIDATLVYCRGPR